MAYRVLEVTLHSARDLKNVNFISRMEVYAVATISGDPLTRQCTPSDPYGGRHPAWNATLRFTVPPAAAAAGGCLHVVLRAERSLGDRDIGEVIIPLTEILSGSGGGGGPYDFGPRPPQFASYQVRKVNRSEPRGVLHLSYRLGPVIAYPVAIPAPAPPSPPYDYLPPPPDAYLPRKPAPPPTPSPPRPVDRVAKSPPPPPMPSPPRPVERVAKPPPPTPPAPRAAVGQVAALPAPVAAKADRHMATPSPAKADWQVGTYVPAARTKGRNNGNLEFEMGLGAGLVGGAIGGMLASDMVSDAAVYNAGYMAGFADREHAVY
ncbi:protein SRC2-like [Oryza brachyantha]|uniref:protein SRC2-like n=1 Tax=Oryza brachyantha TaxID=4533 RepID=UPI001AD9F03E|nr:protein SRC2-like [Oryza brachyantha]